VDHFATRRTYVISASFAAACVRLRTPSVAIADRRTEATVEGAMPNCAAICSSRSPADKGEHLALALRQAFMLASRRLAAQSSERLRIVAAPRRARASVSRRSAVRFETPS
jgi:hypothetical protein